MKFNDLDKITNSPILACFSKEEIIEFIDNNDFKIITYKKNTVLHFEDDLCDKIELVLDGKILIDRIDKSGNFLTVTDFYSGDIIGGNLIFSDIPIYPLIITASTDSTMLEIKKDFLFYLLSTNTEFLKKFLLFMSKNSLILGNKIKQFLNRSIRESIIQYLKHEHRIQNSNNIILNISKKELAEKIGIQRTSLSRELKKMKDENLITFDKISIKIINLNIL